MERKFLAVYYYDMFSGATGFGNVVAYINGDGVYLEDIHKIEKEIIRTTGFLRVVVVNIIPLEGFTRCET